MGAQIAGYLADLGFEVDMFDLPGVARRSWEQMVKQGWCTLTGRFRITPRATGEDDEVLSSASLIVEAVFEDAKVKREVCDRIERHASATCLIATNTSGISIDEMARGRAPEFRRRFFGLHFFNPLKHLAFAELTPGRDTDPDLITAFAEFAEKTLGKGVVIARDTPNFIGNRIGGWALFAPFRFAPPELNAVDIDQTFKAVWGWEPLKTWDIVGLLLAKPVAANVYDRAVDDPEREVFSPEVPSIETLVARGLTGRGSKKKSGFFGLGDRRQKLMFDFSTGEYVPATGHDLPSLKAAARAKFPENLRILLEGEDGAARFARHCFFGLVAYSASLVGKICDEITDVDKAMRWGFNWPRGPFEVAQAYGLDKVLQGIEASGYGKLVPPWLAELATRSEGQLYSKDGSSFHSRKSSRLEPVPLVDGGIYPDRLLNEAGKTLFKNDDAAVVDISTAGAPVCLVVFTSRGNSAGPGTIVALHKAMDWAEGQQGAVVIGNTGRAFCAGANLHWLLEMSESGRADALEQIVKDGQEVTQRLTYCDAVTIAAPHGYTLGGGSEIALGAKVRVVNATVTWGQPEINPGVIPAWGGCMRLLRRALKGHLTYYHWGEFWTREVAGDCIDPVWRLIAWAEMSRDAYDAREMGFLDPEDVIVPAQGLGQPFVLARARQLAAAMVVGGWRRPSPFLFNLPGKALLCRFQAICDQGALGGLFPQHNARIATASANVLCGGDTRLGEPVTESKLLELEREGFMQLVMTKETQAAIRRVLKM
ncbi:MAG: enoyl-CoA hydratase/isomerase family protein [Candidatus Riflebacteria bacterium]|nr:enoyl-CoA hydratase/isomerase family protein [Candidatus Riflebacteria bacterium]